MCASNKYMAPECLIFSGANISRLWIPHQTILTVCVHEQQQWHTNLEKKQHRLGNEDNNHMFAATTTTFITFDRIRLICYALCGGRINKPWFNQFVPIEIMKNWFEIGRNFDRKRLINFDSFIHFNEMLNAWQIEAAKLDFCEQTKSL